MRTARRFRRQTDDHRWRRRRPAPNGKGGYTSRVPSAVSDQLKSGKHPGQALLALFATILGALPGAAATERVVKLPVRGHLDEARIEIRNPSLQPITFSLGVNDQLFEDRRALLASIKAGRAEACRGLEDSKAVMVPCVAFEKTAAALNHHIELTDQFTDESYAGHPRWWMTSPMLAVNSFGFGTCGTFAYVLGKLWRALGYDVRLRELNGHTVTEVLVEGRWLLFDADNRGFFVDGGRPVGVDDLFSNPTLAEPGVASKRLDGERPGDYPKAGLEFYKHLIAASTGQWRSAKAVPSGNDDWRDLTITLPPHSRIILAEPERSRCLYPELVHPSFKNVTDPPYQWAVMQIPAGSVSDIQNGLFPAIVSGDYSLTAVYSTESVLTSDFNELDRFRFSRRFARAFKGLEARSDVTIRYMLNSKFKIRRDNEVRLRGRGVRHLEVAVAQATSEPQEAAPPCIDPPQPAALRVQHASATSYAYGNSALAAHLIDGKFTTGWASAVLDANQPQTVVLDLGTPRVVRGIRWAPDPQYAMMSPSSVVVQTSIDGSDPQEAVRVDHYEPVRFDWLRRDFAPRPARYVTLLLTPRPHFLMPRSFQTILGEIEIVGPESGQ
jgi:hypothetical protein